MFFIGFPIFSYPIRPHAITIIGQTKAYVKPIKRFIKPYADLNTLRVKHTTHQKAESLKAASFSKLDNTVSNNSISNTKYAKFSIK